MHDHPIHPDCTALVTGGASGIGLGIAQALLEAGLCVLVTDVRADHLAAARERLGFAGDRAIFHLLDVASKPQWTAARDLVREHFQDLHVLCLNAGVGVLGSMLETSPEDRAWLMSVNLGGVLYGIEAFLPDMLALERPAHIMATSSMGGLVVANDGGIYSTAKFGVVAVMERLRLELAATSVGTSLLCPSAVNTNIFDHERMRPGAKPGSASRLDEAGLNQMEAMAKGILSQGRTPLEVGVMVREAIVRNDFYIFTDRNVKPILERRRAALLSFAGACP